MADACFQIKGTTVPTIVLDLYDFQAQRFREQLEEKIQAAPQLFSGSPLYMNLTPCESALDEAALAELVGICRELGLHPFACRGGDESLQPALQALGLTPMSLTRSWELNGAPAPQQRPAAAAPAPAAAPAQVPTRVIHRTIRSGQQVYARGGDLIVLAPVNEGAEIIADGNIHVYSTLRGRALAGVKDNPDARIFCQQLEAELVSVAGHFVLHDSLREQCWKQAAQIYLENDTLHITPL